MTGYDGHKRRKGSKVRTAVETLEQLLALHVTPANEQDHVQVAQLARAVQEVCVRLWLWLWLPNAHQAARISGRRSPPSSRAAAPSVLSSVLRIHSQMWLFAASWAPALDHLVSAPAGASFAEICSSRNHGVARNVCWTLREYDENNACNRLAVAYESAA
jgi:hypothetical protein